MALNFQKQTTGTPLHTNSPSPDSRSQDMLTKLSSQPLFIAHENSISTTLSLTISPTPTSCENNGSTFLPSESLNQNSLFIRDSISDNIPDSISDNIPDKIPSLSTSTDDIINFPADGQRPGSSPFINQKNLKKLKPEIKNHLYSSSSSISQPSLPPTITDSRGDLPLPVDPPEMVGIIIAAVIATIVVVLIIKRITFGKIFGNDYVISNGLDENNDPLFDRHDLDIINLQQNPDFYSEWGETPRFFGTLKRWINKLFNRGNNRAKLNKLTSSVNMDITNRLDKKKCSVYRESETMEDSGVGASSVCETEISFPDIHSHVLNWDEYIL
ncbi:16112_t:CDS:2 [Racocetra fulgida]|uniref:16112_t:CDS:1 n=1 Tax=Racocetra fulgida TaxID=60492 RepID=A0A9N9DRG2_9GLOM|nr:16112_t:CDS:2 [Racocetra fulgida]